MSVFVTESVKLFCFERTSKSNVLRWINFVEAINHGGFWGIFSMQNWHLNNNLQRFFLKLNDHSFGFWWNRVNILVTWAICQLYTVNLLIKWVAPGDCGFFYFFLVSDNMY